jgi:ABC-type multidrug transport system ATPase subunit
MYCNDLLVSQNRFSQGSVGIFVMYSHAVHISENLVRGSRGPSGYAIGVKDADDLIVVDNVLSDSRVGVYLDHTPNSPGSHSEIRGNVIALNDVGALLQPSAEGSVFTENTFYENLQQVEVPGSAHPTANDWAGNYWSDASTLDLDGNGVLDAPYRSNHFLEGLAVREPRLRLLLLTPIATALEMGTTMFPIVSVEPTLVDPTPLAKPASLPASALDSARAPLVPALAVAIAGALMGATIIATPHVVASREIRQNALRVRIRQASYGRSVVLRDISFDAAPGETIALWGENGSGKTTLLRAMLGLVRCSGGVNVTRAQIGYVPQETPRHEWSVRTTLEYYAALRGVSPSAALEAARESGLVTTSSGSVAALSGGQRQRLSLALARMGNPPVLLLDEPTANLDETSRGEHVRLVRELHGRGRIVIFATHHVEEVVALADRVLIVEGGRIGSDLTLREFCDRIALRENTTLCVASSSLGAAREALSGVSVEFEVDSMGRIDIRGGAVARRQALDALASASVAILDVEVMR